MPEGDTPERGKPKPIPQDAGKHMPRRERPVPPMRVVTKGWWTLREDRASVESLEQEEKDERK